MSGGEVQQAIDCHFDPKHIAFAGVGKSDQEISLAQRMIFCFNVESLQECMGLMRLKTNKSPLPFD